MFERYRNTYLSLSIIGFTCFGFAQTTIHRIEPIVSSTQQTTAIYCMLFMYVIHSIALYKR